MEPASNFFGDNSRDYVAGHHSSSSSTKRLEKMVQEITGELATPSTSGKDEVADNVVHATEKPIEVIVNGTFGLTLALGLLAIGAPYAFLWGFLGVMLRYVPYVGPWIVAMPPLLLFMAVAHGRR